MRRAGGPGTRPPLFRWTHTLPAQARHRALLLRPRCRLSTRGVAVAPGAGTPVVSVVFDRGGEVAACVADVALLEAALTPALLRRRFAPAIAAAPLLVLDGNLSAAAIEVGNEVV